ncbi:MAG TPA: hypothetical protein VFX30_01895 [bacterium]|nr:hypothetical protein [bacterium]
MPSWAYTFRCPTRLHDLEAALNAAGPWEWRLRDCAWYPDFLQCRPVADVSIQIDSPKEGDCRCLIVASDGAGLSREQIDRTLTGILEKVETGEREEIAAYEGYE